MAKKLWQRLGLPKPKSEASGGPLSLIDNEVYSGIELPAGAPFFVRLDGWAFRSLAKKLHFEKPYDRFLADALTKTAATFFLPFNPTLAYIFSDEINFFFSKSTTFTRIEKIDSVFAGLAASVFAAQLRKKYEEVPPIAFDCRCIPLTSKEEMIKYLVWRQAEAFRNHNNAWAQHVVMSKEGLSARAVTKRLAGLRVAELRKLLTKYGFDLERTPAWQRLGILLYKQKYKKVGYDPIAKKRVVVNRFRIAEEWSPPIFNTVAGKKFLERFL